MTYNMSEEQQIICLKSEVVGMDKVLSFFSDLAGDYLRKGDGEIMRRYNLANNLRKSVVQDIMILDEKVRSNQAIYEKEFSNVNIKIMDFRSILTKGTHTNGDHGSILN